MSKPNKKAYNAALKASKAIKKKDKNASSAVKIEGTEFFVFCNGIIFKKTGKKAGKGRLVYKQLKKEQQHVDFKKLMERVRKGRTKKSGCGTLTAQKKK
tara:strand:+ start:461 stop:757 length:297 start_codon:yes stop_codon:yes gene_type:complete